MADSSDINTIRYGVGGIGDKPTDDRIEELMTAADDDTTTAALYYWRGLQADILAEPQTASLGGDASRTWGKDQIGYITGQIELLEGVITLRDTPEQAPRTIQIVRDDAERLFT